MVFTVIKNSNNFCTTCHHFLCKRNWISFGFLMKSTNYISCDKQVNAMCRVCSSRGRRKAELYALLVHLIWILKKEQEVDAQTGKSEHWRTCEKSEVRGRGSLNGWAAHRCCGKRRGHCFCGGPGIIVLCWRGPLRRLSEESRPFS